MEPRVRYIIVGLFALLTGLAGLGFILWIQNKGSLRGRSELIVRFESSAPGLRTGAPVTFNGVRVGEVRRLAFDKTNLNAVDAHLAIDRDAPITAATQATLEAQGLLGAVYVSLAGGDLTRPLDRAKGAPVIVAQGATSLSETLAQYSALIVMEKTYGHAGIRKFLKYELDRYLRSRGAELVEEQPLLRVENQDYIHYRKGSLVMYLLRDRIGEAKVNAALRTLLKQYAFKGAPYPRSQDLVDALRAQAGADPAAQQLITDLFENITLYDLKTRTAAVTKRADGRYDVTLTVEAKKAYADGRGKETPVPIPAGEVFDIGVFTAEPGKPGFSAKEVLMFRTTGLRSGVQTLTVTVPRAPKFAGVDPYNKQIDRNSDDNAIRVTGG